MLPTSHIGPMNSSLAANTTEELLARFNEFIDSANRLESSHLSCRTRWSGAMRTRGSQPGVGAESQRRRLHPTDARSHTRIIPCGVVLLDSRVATLLANPEAQRLLWNPGENGLSYQSYPSPIQQVLMRALSNADGAMSGRRNSLRGDPCRRAGSR